MVNTASDAEGSGANNFGPEAHLLCSLSTEQRIAWQAQILQTTAEHMAKLQEIISVQASILKSNNGVSIVNHQESSSTPSLPPFNKGKLAAMQQQVLEGVTQQKNSHQSQENDQIGSLKKPLKRQVVKALKSMKSNEGISDKPLGIQEACHCCRHYGFPCLLNNSSKINDKTSQNYHHDADKKRKTISQEPQLESIQHLGLTAPSHVDKKKKVISQEPQLENSQHLGLTAAPSVLVQCSSNEGPNPKEAAVPQARGNPHFPQVRGKPHEIFVDGWSITYKEFQPRKGKHAKKQTSEISEVKMNSQNQQASDSLLPHGTSLKGAQSHQGSTPVNACFHCQEEGHFMAHCPKKDRASDSLVPHGTSLKGAQSHQGSTPGKAAGKACFHCQEGGHFVADCPKKYQASDSLVPHGTSLKGVQSHQGSTPGKAAGKACFRCQEGHLVANCPKKYPLLFGNGDSQEQNLSPSEGKICNQTPVHVLQSSCIKGSNFICGAMDHSNNQSPNACKSVTRKLQSPQPSNTPGQHTSSEAPCEPMSNNTSMKSNTPKYLVPRLSQVALGQLNEVNAILEATQLSSDNDRRLSPFSKGPAGLDSGAIYQMLKARGQTTDASAQFIWRNPAPPRVQLFMWLLTKGRIQSRSVLHRKHVLPDAVCEICNAHVETPEHIIGGCELGRAFWQRIGLPEVIGLPVSSLHTISPPSGFPREDFAAFMALSCWNLWKARDEAVFRGERLSVDQVLQACSAAAKLWKPRFKKKRKHIVDLWCQALDQARSTQ